MVIWKVKSFGPYGQSQRIEEWLNEIQQSANIVKVELHPYGFHGETIATVKAYIVDSVDEKDGANA